MQQQQPLMAGDSSPVGACNVHIGTGGSSSNNSSNRETIRAKILLEAAAVAAPLVNLHTPSRSCFPTTTPRSVATSAASQLLDIVSVAGHR